MIQGQTVLYPLAQRILNITTLQDELLDLYGQKDLTGRTYHADRRGPIGHMDHHSPITQCILRNLHILRSQRSLGDL